MLDVPGEFVPPSRRKNGCLPPEHPVAAVPSPATKQGNAGAGCAVPVENDDGNVGLLHGRTYFSLGCRIFLIILMAVNNKNFI